MGRLSEEQVNTIVRIFMAELEDWWTSHAIDNQQRSGTTAHTSERSDDE